MLKKTAAVTAVLCIAGSALAGPGVAPTGPRFFAVLGGEEYVVYYSSRGESEEDMDLLKSMLKGYFESGLRVKDSCVSSRPDLYGEAVNVTAALKATEAGKAAKRLAVMVRCKQQPVKP